jgi:hypothetical protein
MTDNNNNETANAGENAEKQVKKLNINMFEVLDLCAGILNRAFVQGPQKDKEKAKELFKEIKSGKNYPMGTLTFGGEMKVDFKLALDYSEFVGAGFNFDVFSAAVFSLVQRIHEKLVAKEPIDLLSGENGVAVNMPGVVQTTNKGEEQFNVLFMALDFPSPKEFVLKLMFVDPEQFRRQDEAVETAENAAS